MALEDRDWYRDKPSEAGRSQWKRGDGGSSSGGSFGVRSGAWLAVVVSGLATLVTWHFDLLNFRRRSSPSRCAARVTGIPGAASGKAAAVLSGGPARADPGAGLASDAGDEVVAQRPEVREGLCRGAGRSDAARGAGRCPR